MYSYTAWREKFVTHAYMYITDVKKHEYESKYVSYLRLRNTGEKTYTVTGSRDHWRVTKPWRPWRGCRYNLEVETELD